MQRQPLFCCQTQNYKCENHKRPHTNIGFPGNAILQKRAVK
jgi:hypothetical protein